MYKGQKDSFSDIFWIALKKNTSRVLIAVKKGNKKNWLCVSYDNLNTK